MDGAAVSGPAPGEPELDEARLRAALAAARSIFVAGGAACPSTVVEWLNRHPEATADREWIFAQPAGYAQPPLRAPGGRVRVFFHLPEMAGAPEVELVPMQYREIARWLAEPDRLDLVIAQVAPSPAGLSLGLGVDFLPAALSGGRRLLVERNRSLPAAMGAPVLPLSRAEVVCDSAVAPAEVEPGDASPTVQRIAEQVAALIDDGDCLQLGVGALPDAVLSRLHSRRDLGIHSGMVSDGVRQLVQYGAVTGARKTIDRHLLVTGFLLGSADLYRWATNEPTLRLRPVGYTHDAGVLASLRQLVSINSAAAVDLLGEVNGERIRGRAVNAVGRQVDFLRAASASPGGRSILALPATAARGSASRIVARIAEGAVVTSCRTDVDWVVTEWGSARLRGATESERRERLIAVAAPEFRDDLTRGSST